MSEFGISEFGLFDQILIYCRGKRDGLSKEGSGRVAIYKTIGLIKCYTLEGNYNSGKYVNVLPPRGKEPNVRRICTNPPKYTPVIFEEVGRALGPSILDLTDSNPVSRLRNSEFRSLQGLRNSLRNNIERGPIRSESLPKVNFPANLLFRFNEQNLLIIINSQLISFVQFFSNFFLLLLKKYSESKEPQFEPQ